MANVYAAAQISSRRGDVAGNLETHLRAAKCAADAGVDILVFPELSLTGYELDLADALQAAPGDSAFEPLQNMAQQHDMLVLAGVPVKADTGKPYLGALILGGEVPTHYAKMHLHGVENDHFQAGKDYGVTRHAGLNVGAAICADLTHLSHAAGMRAAGADVYAVGALLNEAAIGREAPLLEGYAREHSMTVIFSNYATSSGAYVAAGKSSVWAPGGTLVAQTESTEEALVIADNQNGSWRGRVVPL